MKILLALAWLIFLKRKGRKMSKLVFLGGTVGKNLWRDQFIQDLVARGVNPAQLFNPVVEDWNEEVQKREEEAKKNASHLVFFLGTPKLDGIPLSTYSMLEATMALYDRPKETVVVFDPAGIEGHSLKAYKQSEKVLRARFPKANIFSTLVEATNWLAKELL